MAKSIMRPSTEPKDRMYPAGFIDSGGDVTPPQANNPLISPRVSVYKDAFSKGNYGDF